MGEIWRNMEKYGEMKELSSRVPCSFVMMSRSWPPWPVSWYPWGLFQIQICKSMESADCQIQNNTRRGNKTLHFARGCFKGPKDDSDCWDCCIKDIKCLNLSCWEFNVTASGLMVLCLAVRGRSTPAETPRKMHLKWFKICEWSWTSKSKSRQSRNSPSSWQAAIDAPDHDGQEGPNRCVKRGETNWKRPDLWYCKYHDVMSVNIWQEDMRELWNMILKHLKIVYMIITYDFRNESKPASLRGAQEVYSVVLGNSRSRGAGHGGAWRGMAGHGGAGVDAGWDGTCFEDEDVLRPSKWWSLNIAILPLCADAADLALGSEMIWDDLSFWNVTICIHMSRYVTICHHSTRRRENQRNVG